ncbi:MAG: hypothetical protein MR371_04395 [Clostridia bacterium]|nr:hypothetical protein [Clostridia bacterium]
MGVFGHFKKSKPELSDEEIRLNQMWALWAEGHADSPWRELTTYQGEVNKGRRDQYFLNTGNTGDLQKKMAILETVLLQKLQSNLRKAYAAYRALSEKEPDGRAQTILEQCDEVFDENEREIDCILKAHARETLRRRKNGQSDLVYHYDSLQRAVFGNRRLRLEQEKTDVVLVRNERQ